MLGLTRVPQSASVISSTRLTERPAKYTSISASSNELLAIAADYDRLNGHCEKTASN